MKRIIIILIVLMMLCSCSYSNNPKSKVEELFTKYQLCDEDIKEGINDILEKESLTEDQKERYREIIEKQYKNLTYEIIDEEIDGDRASVIVSIVVFNYKKTINDVNNMFVGKDDYTVEEYNNVKLDKLEKVKEKVKYKVTIEEIKNQDGSWKINNLDNETIKKIQGMY